MLRVILARTMRPVFVGVAVGSAGAVASAGVLSSLLFGVSRIDPIGIGSAVIFVAGVAFVACLVPARRGLRFDPMTALRSE